VGGCLVGSHDEETEEGSSVGSYKVCGMRMSASEQEQVGDFSFGLKGA
jgi:hypothetical protein